MCSLPVSARSIESSYYWPASLLLFGHLTNAINPGQMLCDVVEKFANEWIPLEYSVTLMWFFVFTVHCFFLRGSIHSCRPLPLLHDNIKLLHVFINFVLLNTSPWFYLFSSDLFLRAVQPLGHSLPENSARWLIELEALIRNPQSIASLEQPVVVRMQ